MSNAQMNNAGSMFGELENDMADAPANGGSKKQKPKAQFWLNPGVVQLVGGEETFIGLPFGIPLDTMNREDETKGTERGRKIRRKKNQVLDAFLVKARSLKPGEEQLIPGPGGITLQLRHADFGQNDEMDEEDETPIVLNF